VNYREDFILYKKSMYNIEVDSTNDGRILLFNTRTSAFGIMDSESKKIYNSIEKYQRDDFENLTLKKISDSFLSNGYIIAEDIDELGIVKLKERFSKYSGKHLCLTIAPTLDCNMSCPYCFERENPIYMNNDTQEALIRFAESYIKLNNCESVQVVWYGGEPLLAKDAVLNLGRRFIELCANEEVEYSSFMVTNGYLFDKETAQILFDDCAIKNVQITVDGMPEEHNVRRVLRNGKDSFDTIIKNINDCKDFININLRMNLDKLNVESARKFWTFAISEKGWGKNPNISISPVFDYNPELNYQDNLLSDKDFSIEHKKLLKCLNENISDFPINALLPQCHNGYCGAVKYGNYVIDSDGDFYTCWSCIGNKAKSIGNVKNGIKINTEYIKWLMHEPNPTCESCVLLPVCSGGCPYFYFLNNEPQCDIIKHTYKEKLKLLHKKYSEGARSL